MKQIWQLVLSVDHLLIILNDIACIVDYLGISTTSMAMVWDDCNDGMLRNVINNTILINFKSPQKNEIFEREKHLSFFFQFCSPNFSPFHHLISLFPSVQLVDDVYKGCDIVVLIHNVNEGWFWKWDKIDFKRMKFLKGKKVLPLISNFLSPISLHSIIWFRSFLLSNLVMMCTRDVIWWCWFQMWMKGGFLDGSKSDEKRYSK